MSPVIIGIIIAVAVILLAGFFSRFRDAVDNITDYIGVALRFAGISLLLGFGIALILKLILMIFNMTISLITTTLAFSGILVIVFLFGWLLTENSK